MSRAGQRPAELATVLAQAASFGGPAVAFEVVHRTREHLTTPLAMPAESDWAGICRETLVFDLPSAGFRVHTGFAESPASTMAGLGSLDARPCAGGFSYQGTASLNPRFLYDSSRDHELLLSVGEKPWRLDHTDSLLMTRIMAELAAGAASDETRSPILLLQSPVAPFRNWAKWPENQSGEPPKIARGAAIRLSVGVDGDNGEGRLALIGETVRIAREYGLQLHLGDRRLGRVRGEWKGAVQFAPDRYAEKRGEVEAAPGDPGQAMLVTFVGPARVGSSASVLEALAKSGVGVLAVTMASLQELAFINLVVAVPPGSTPRPPREDQRVQPAVDGVNWLAAVCGESGEALTVPRAIDYQVCLTGPVPWQADTEYKAHPLWLQWHAPVSKHEALTVIDDVILELLRSDIVSDAQLDYCRSRMTGDGRICSAKVSVRLVSGIAEDDLPDKLSVLCRATQAEVEWKRTTQDPDGRSVGLKVAWRERWLGRVRSTGVV
ncbi:hypothetical protein EV644_101879 [Kribbella orskensis]|uniref:Uncharacterized protein n=1 Tax=Kribbella orskensis TaxID=2512216 RepID=A0ABY2BVB0_9ACTN|nr:MULTISPECIES: hypothetical protein [Kribbella]TCN43986.1 hypothetical protein EV642_101110 [Kribbella sp. VKM Ac-2500]TCO32236.1 hypothetical protein EV644_101879 [Kribbella orskensis]